MTTVTFYLDLSKLERHSLMEGFHFTSEYTPLNVTGFHVESFNEEEFVTDLGDFFLF